MAKNADRYQVFQEQGEVHVMFGIKGEQGIKVGHISTDYHEVSGLCQACNRFRVSPIHLAEVVEDFRKY